MRLFHDRKYVANDYNMFIEKQMNWCILTVIVRYIFIFYLFIHNYFNVLTNNKFHFQVKNL